MILFFNEIKGKKNKLKKLKAMCFEYKKKDSLYKIEGFEKKSTIV